MSRRTAPIVLLALVLLAGGFLPGASTPFFGPAPVLAATELHFLSVARGEPRRPPLVPPPPLN